MNLFSGKGLAGVKRALSRFWALFTRHTWKLLGSGALAAASGLVYALGVYISVDTHALLPLMLAAPLGGLLAAPPSQRMNACFNCLRSK